MILRMIERYRKRKALQRPVTAGEMIECLETLRRISNQVLDAARLHVCEKNDAWTTMLSAMADAISEEAELLQDEDLQ